MRLGLRFITDGSMKKYIAVTVLLASTSALAAPAIVASPAYKECTALAASNPAAALAKADEWLKIDQSIAAQHCRAMALFSLKRFDEAAQALGDVRNTLGPDNLSLRIYVTHQVAQAWINAGHADNALNDYATQLTYLTGIKGNNATTARLSAELLLDKARLNVTYGKLADAAADLDHAISLTPLNADLLLARAQVFVELGDAELAKLDAQSVLKLRPHDAKAEAILNGAVATPATAALTPIPMNEEAAPVTPVSTQPQPTAAPASAAAPAGAPAAAGPKAKPAAKK